jgi:tRNA (pseudouridine54-N1)-methyltransferase
LPSPTRIFLLKASEARTTGDFSLKDLPSSSGRLDIVCRCAISSLLQDEVIRSDTVFVTTLGGPPNPPLTLRFDGGTLKSLPFSEVGVAEILKRLLDNRSEHDSEHTSWEGIRIERRSFAEVINYELDAHESSRLYYLHENGDDIRDIDVNLDDASIFALGSNKGLTAEDEKILDQAAAQRVSVGPISYLSSQVITLVHDELDRRRRTRPHE